MTHKDIYTKFMIEYDKANVTSSYPSLTEYEVATVLDKAYNALIAQKVTGNNVRRAGFETDLKSIADIQSLIMQKTDAQFVVVDNSVAPNVIQTSLPSTCLYFINAYLDYNAYKETTVQVVECDFDSSAAGLSDPGHIYGQNVFKLNTYDKNLTSPEDYSLIYDGEDTSFRYCRVSYTPTDQEDDWAASSEIKTGTIEDVKEELFVNNEGSVPFIFVWLDNKNAGETTMTVIRKDFPNGKPYDDKVVRMVPTRLVNHEIASKFFSSAFNMPWIKIPVSYIENNKLYVVYDLLNRPRFDNATIVYIKKPNPFVKNLSDLGLTLQERAQMAELTYFDYKFIQNGTTGYDAAQQDTADTKLVSTYTFECTDTMAEELISLAIAFALENVESQRLNTKLNMRGLEA